MWERLSRIPYTGWNRKEGRGNKDLKKGGGGEQAGSRGGRLKKVERAGTLCELS